MEKDRIWYEELVKRYDTFLQSEELQNYLTTRDFKNKLTKEKEEGRDEFFIRDEQEQMRRHLGTTSDCDKEALINFFFLRLRSQDNLTSATSSDPVSLIRGDDISSLTSKFSSGNQSDGHYPILDLSEQIEAIESVKVKY